MTDGPVIIGLDPARGRDSTAIAISLLANSSQARLITVLDRMNDCIDGIHRLAYRVADRHFRDELEKKREAARRNWLELRPAPFRRVICAYISPYKRPRRQPRCAHTAARRDRRHRRRTRWLAELRA